MTWIASFAPSILKMRLTVGRTIRDAVSIARAAAATVQADAKNKQIKSVSLPEHRGPLQILCPAQVSSYTTAKF